MEVLNSLKIERFQTAIGGRKSLLGHRDLVIIDEFQTAIGGRKDFRNSHCSSDSPVSDRHWR